LARFAGAFTATKGTFMSQQLSSNIASPGRLVVKTGVHAGRLAFNHNAKRLVVKSGVRAGAMTFNHNAKRLVVKAGVRAGGLQLNHNAKRLA
jgi:hypothetical protein